MRSLIIFLCGGLLWLNLLIGCSGTEQSKLLKVEQSAKSIQAIIQIDNVRRNTCRKVLQIIARHNSEMPTRLKQEIANEIYTMSQKYPNLDVDLICATITHESARTWDPKVVSKAGALGLMQIMPSTGEWLAKYEGIPWTSPEEILYNPIYNIRIGARYLSALIETYDLEGGLAAYNGGAKRAEMWLTNNKADGILWAETNEYIPSILKIYDEYKSSAL